MNVCCGYINIEKFFPEIPYLVRACQFSKRLIDKPGRAGILKLEHVSFRHQPVTKVRAFQKERFTIHTNDIFSSCGEKGLSTGTGIQDNRK